MKRSATWDTELPSAWDVDEIGIDPAADDEEDIDQLLSVIKSTKL